ncbi:response regulator transcription factor [Pseudomonas sp. GM25]|uniref:response regulator transcription factor n=1 Tax=Pseudomonas sp. GM25 TaxID=1144327 RepID=UPI00026FE344|nr:response regulator transcription factor [Pseudomonas sp. GM25]EJM27406.1 response regulator containing a CheY-like receiver domain and an HTH DNA-binding domain [Pseudomonas sp. GM25]
MYSALVVDDHPCIRLSVGRLLVEQGFGAVAEADNGTDAVRLAGELEPDLVLLEFSSPAIGGLEVISRLTRASAASKILVLTSELAVRYSMRCMKAGAAGFLCKTDEPEELVKAVQVVMGGYTFFPDSGHGAKRRHDAWAADPVLVQSLSERELSILQQLSRGMTNKQIADALLISNKTVSTYKTRLIAKLKVRSVVSLAEFARRNHLV